MRTKYCPHCGSENIERINEKDGSHYHECLDCQEAWEHHVIELKCYGCGNCPYCRGETL